MKLMTKGRGELHKRLLNKACNKPKITGGRRGGGKEGCAARGCRLVLCAALQRRSSGDRAEGPRPYFMCGTNLRHTVLAMRRIPKIPAPKTPPGHLS